MWTGCVWYFKDIKCPLVNHLNSYREDLTRLPISISFHFCKPYTKMSFFEKNVFQHFKENIFFRWNTGCYKKEEWDFGFLPVVNKWAMYFFIKVENKILLIK